MYYVTLNINDKEIDKEVFKDDFIEYLWEIEVGTKFNPLSYVLYDPRSVIYKKMEQKWVNNELDELEIIKREDFLDFMYNKYKEELE